MWSMWRPFAFLGALILKSCAALRPQDLSPPELALLLPTQPTYNIDVQVRDVIEAERFMTPRISLRPEGGSNDFVNGQVGVGPRSPDGSPFLFEVLGAAGPDLSQQAAGVSAEMSLDFSRRVGSTSLETCPPPALDVRRWTEAIGSDFMVRGPSYLTTRIKVPSAKQVRTSSVRLW